MKNILLFFLSDIHVDDKTQEFRRSPYIGRSGKEFTCPTDGKRYRTIGANEIIVIYE